MTDLNKEINVLKGILALMIPSAIFFIYFIYFISFFWFLHDNIYAQATTLAIIIILALCFYSMKSIVGYHKIMHKRIKNGNI